jgi:WD40 repeat protein
VNCSASARILAITFTLVLVLFMSGCPATEVQDSTLVPVSPSAMPPGETSVSIPTPIFTLAPTATPALQPAPSPIPTATPIPPIFSPAPTSDNPQYQVLHPNAGAILGLAFGSDNARLTILAAEGVYTYRGGSLQEQWRWPSPVDRSLTSLSPDGKLAAVVVEEKDRKRIEMWDTDSARRLRSLSEKEQEYFYGLQFSADSSRLAASVGDGQVVIWDVNNGQMTRTLNYESGWHYLPNPPYGLDLAFSPDGKIFSAGYGPGLILWNIQTGTQTIGETGCHGDTTFDQIYTPDGKTLFIACGPDAFPLGFLSFWDIRAQRLVDSWHECVSIHALAYSPDGEMLALGYYDGNIDIEFPAAQMSFSRAIRLAGHSGPQDAWTFEHEVIVLAFSPNSKRLASGSLDGSVIIWDLSTLKQDPSPSGCTLRLGQVIHSGEGARLWSQPDASKGMVLMELTPGQPLCLLSDPVFGPVTKSRSLSGWFWQVSLSPSGEISGWIWQDRVQECPS